MKILFLSYWSINDGLTRSTVIPHIDILSEFDDVEEVFLFTIEREKTDKEYHVKNKKVRHIGLISKWGLIRIFNKIYDFIFFPRIIRKFLKSETIDLLISRGAPAGSIGLLAKKNSRIPFVVESFEPHADYMLESGVWKKNSISYKLQKKWEKEMIRVASAILPVSMNYLDNLKKSSKSPKMYLAPCAVNYSQFSFKQDSRQQLRKELGVNSDQLLGIYVGKFGDIYLDEMFFLVLKSLSVQFAQKFKFIILSPQDQDEIKHKIQAVSLIPEDIIVTKVDHSDVPKYLSASDYALNTVKPSPNRKYCSPIKTGEYWANGLPILITPGIGDDSEIIEKNKIGGILDLDDIEESTNSFIQVVKSKSREEWNEKISPFAKKYRSFDFVKNAYSEILKGFD